MIFRASSNPHRSTVCSWAPFCLEHCSHCAQCCGWKHSGLLDLGVAVCTSKLLSEQQLAATCSCEWRFPVFVMQPVMCNVLMLCTFSICASAIFNNFTSVCSSKHYFEFYIQIYVFRHINVLVFYCMLQNSNFLSLEAWWLAGSSAEGKSFHRSPPLAPSSCLQCVRRVSLSHPLLELSLPATPA